jgi:molecular chaperone HtpG
MNDLSRDLNRLPSNAEQKAKLAEAASAFSGLNILHIRRQVAQFLSLIGREGIFDQYTVHDISHIDKMLASLDWIVPEATKVAMSPVDWLMTTLAIYFHDMGMLVTAREYDARMRSDFPRYRDEVLFGGPSGADYKSKVDSLGTDRAERFLYQEWVRHKHAERVRAWISGVVRDDLGAATETFAQIGTLLAPLGSQFRRDLGLICESHHLNDLNDIKKYKPSQPYGDNDAETANLQYCAVLLRTADLLHITSDRTPSTVFKTINPTDPISQQEWAKQLAVKRLRPKMGVNEDGIPDDRELKDTIEVHAYFTDDNGFFGLTSYLLYAGQELKQSHEWIATTKKLNLAKHEFPWKRIDDSHIETEGFIPDSFEFTLDQAKILDLLTGHTLYNDTRVVLRELVQNALDAIRLKFYPESPGASGQLQVHWNSKERLLSVRDNGTGMSQKEISAFLLRVGSSRYQDPDFKKQFPGFSSISRFGIGVLSTFMIADSVEITTCHPEDDQARRLALRSVHGKYLVSLLPKTDPSVRKLYPHGTALVLRVRPSVKVHDLIETSKLWVVLPNCQVTAQVDEAKPVMVGYNSTSDALAAILLEHGVEAEIAKDNKVPDITAGAKAVRVLNVKENGVDVAFAVKWSEYFREWEFLDGGRLRPTDDEEPIALGTCVEGIRVEAHAPGFDGNPIVALANLSGPNAPKTNVARSGLEATPERDAVLRHIYRIYAGHTAKEARELYSNRSFSLTWAAEEARYLAKPLQGERRDQQGTPISSVLLSEEMEQLDVLPVEENGERKLISARALAERPEFWTIESELLRSAEPLIREASTSASLSSIIAVIDVGRMAFPDSLVLCGLRPTEWFGRLAFRDREVDRIVIRHAQRRLDVRWVPESKPRRWRSLPPNLLTVRRRVSSSRQLRRNGRQFSMLVGTNGIEVENLSGEVAVKLFRQIYILPGTSVSTYLQRWNDSVAKEPGDESAFLAVFVHDVIAECCDNAIRITNADAFVKRRLRGAESDYLPPGLFERGANLSELIDLVGATHWRTFDPLAWRRSTQPSPYQYDDDLDEYGPF